MILNFSSLSRPSSVSSCSTFLLLSAVWAVWSSVHVLCSFDTVIILLSFLVCFSFFSMPFSSVLWHFLGEFSSPVGKLHAHFHPFPSGFFVLEQVGCLFGYLCLNEIDFSRGTARSSWVGERPPPECSQPHCVRALSTASLPWLKASLLLEEGPYLPTCVSLDSSQPLLCRVVCLLGDLVILLTFLSARPLSSFSLVSLLSSASPSLPALDESASCSQQFPLGRRPLSTPIFPKTPWWPTRTIWFCLYCLLALVTLFHFLVFRLGLKTTYLQIRFEKCFKFVPFLIS